MESIYILIPISIVLVAAAVGIFIWATNSGQFDDLESPAWRILRDDESRRSENHPRDDESRRSENHPRDDESRRSENHLRDDESRRSENHPRDESRNTREHQDGH